MENKEKFYNKTSVSLKIRRNNVFRKRLISNPTVYETKFKKLLDEINIRYMFQKGFIKGDLHCIVDFYLPKPYKLCIEIDGEYHNELSQVAKDINRNKYLGGFREFTVLHFTNKEVSDKKEFVIEKLLSTMAKSKKRNENKTFRFIMDRVRNNK